jgi:uncharacterized protein (DUF1015 family)
MANIKAFRAWRYDQRAAGAVETLITQPYDVIDTVRQKAYYAANPYNIIRLELGITTPGDDENNNRYSRAAADFAAWRQAGVLKRDDALSLYPYVQEYTVEKRNYKRRGFLATVKANGYQDGQVLPHEETLPGHKEDRYRLMQACRANFSPVFGLYNEESRAIDSALEQATAGQAPLLDLEDEDGVRHLLWQVTDESVIGLVEQAMAAQKIYIADGHHRYETACTYRQQIDDMGLLHSKHPANYVLMVCVAMEDPGLIVMPTHRLFPGLPNLTSEELATKLDKCFRLETVGKGADEAPKVWQRIEKEYRQDAIGLYTPKDQTWSLTALTEEGKARMDEIAQDHHPEWRELGVSLLHRLIVETLLETPEPPKPTYVHLVEEVVSELRSGNYSLAALVMPATVNHIKALSLLGDRMPAKSTYFYPKLIAGFVFNPLE